MHDDAPCRDPGWDSGLGGRSDEEWVEPRLRRRSSELALRLVRPQDGEVGGGRRVVGEEDRCRRADGRGPGIKRSGSAKIADEHVARGVVGHQAGSPRQLVSREADAVRVIVIPARLVVVVLVAHEPVRVGRSRRDVLSFHHQSGELVGAGRCEDLSAVEGPDERSRAAQLDDCHTYRTAARLGDLLNRSGECHRAARHELVQRRDELTCGRHGNGRRRRLRHGQARAGARTHVTDDRGQGDEQHAYGKEGARCQTHVRELADHNSDVAARPL